MVFLSCLQKQSDQLLCQHEKILHQKYMQENQKILQHYKMGEETKTTQYPTPIQTEKPQKDNKNDKDELCQVYQYLKSIRD